MDNQGNSTSHLMGTWTRFSNLMQLGIQLVIVLDGKAPDLKIKEQEERAHRKRMAQEKFEEAREEEDEERMAKYAKQTSRLTRDMTRESEELMKAMGLPVIRAPSESDAQMAFMCEQEDVYACASSDYDCLLQGAPRLITNHVPKRKLPSGIYVKITPSLSSQRNTHKFRVKQDQLIAIGILVGTDYNEGINRVGPKLR